MKCTNARQARTVFTSVLISFRASTFLEDPCCEQKVNVPSTADRRQLQSSNATSRPPISSPLHFKSITPGPFSYIYSSVELWSPPLLSAHMYTYGLCSTVTPDVAACRSVRFCVSSAIDYIPPHPVPLKALALLYTLDSRARALRERAGGRGITSLNTSLSHFLFLLIWLLCKCQKYQMLDSS